MTTTAILLLTSPLTYAKNEVMEISVNLPKLNVQPYHRPYVAIWVEDNQRKAVANISSWLGEDEWHKDLRQWWRKIGSKKKNVDAFTGATRRPGTYKLTWDGTNFNGDKLPAGEYLLNIEAVREEGGRSYKRVPFMLPGPNKLTISAQAELGKVNISIN